MYRLMCFITFAKILFMASFYKLKIDNITRETKSTISVSFSIPDDLKSFYTFIPGQYVTIKLTLDNIEIRRAYSICSSPASGELRVAIKEVQNGLFSTFANKNLKEGDILEVGLPEGKFTLETAIDKQKNYAAFVAGSGITPVFSILKSVLENQPKSTFVLVYGNKTKEDTIFYNQLHKLQQDHVGQLFVHYVMSKNDTQNNLSGRINEEIVNQIIAQKHKEKDFDTFFLCGPEQMISTVSSELKKHNIPDKKIKFELFTSTSNTQNTENTNNGTTKINVILDGDQTSFDMSQKETILDATLKKGLDAPYSCQGGVCSSCLARVTKGNAIMKKNAILTPDEIQEGLILTCQAHPTTPEIQIDFDDV